MSDSMAVKVFRRALQELENESLSTSEKRTYEGRVVSMAPFVLKELDGVGVHKKGRKVPKKAVSSYPDPGDYEL
jgi:hypothetical protein